MQSIGKKRLNLIESKVLIDKASITPSDEYENLVRGHKYQRSQHRSKTPKKDRNRKFEVSKSPI